MPRSGVGRSDQVLLPTHTDLTGRGAVAPRDNQKKLEAWVDRDLFDQLTDWCSRNNVGSKVAWLEAAILTVIEYEKAAENLSPESRLRYDEMIVTAREIHARRSTAWRDQ